MIDLACILQKSGKDEEAEGTCREVLTELEKVLGKDHPTTVYGAETLAGMTENYGVRSCNASEISWLLVQIPRLC
jgi:hypothetical protein